MLRRFIPYYRPYLKLLSLDLFCALLIGATGLLFPLMIRHLTNEVFLMADVDAMISSVITICFWLLVLFIIQTVAQYYVTYWGHYMGAKMETDMRSRLFSHYEKLSFSYYDKTNIGVLMNRLISGLFDISELAHHGPEDVFISLIKILGSFIILAGIHWPTTLFLAAVTLVMAVFSYRINRQMRQTFMDNRIKIADVNSIVKDSLSGMRTVQSFANEALELEKFEVCNQNFLQSKRANYRVMGSFVSVNSFLQGLLYIAVVLSGGYFVARGELPATDLIVYVLYINLFLEPLKRLINFTEMFQKGMTGFIRMCEVLDTVPDVRDRKTAVDAGMLKGKIVFDNVSFTYEGEPEPVLEKLSLVIEPKKTLALVGPSGAGKSTFCSLIPRFYDVTDGSVSIDGTDVRDFTLGSLRARIGVVQQDVHIFNSSVRDNIAYGNPEASEAELIEAAKLANIHEFIESLPNGYDTEVGEHGVRFSGGQKQRIAIARVFLKNPPILILDEATSALDNENERFIQASLAELARGRTTIVIAHRLSTIRNADEIAVLTDGGIAERGSHDELIALGGLYRHLYDLQFVDAEEVVASAPTCDVVN